MQNNSLIKQDEINISCLKCNLQIIRNFIQRNLEHCGYPEDSSFYIIQGVDELCTNLMSHGHNYQDEFNLDIQIFCMSKSVIIRVKDYSDKPFDFRQYEIPSMNEIISTKKSGGMGIALIKAHFDFIDYQVENRTQIFILKKEL